MAGRSACAHQLAPPCHGGALAGKPFGALAASSQAYNVCAFEVCHTLACTLISHMGSVLL